MGYWDSYWKWFFSPPQPEEHFEDKERGISYHARGKTRSMRGLFRNFDLGEPTKKAEPSPHPLGLIIQAIANKQAAKKLEYKKP